MALLRRLIMKTSEDIGGGGGFDELPWKTTED